MCKKLFKMWKCWLELTNQANPKNKVFIDSHFSRQEIIVYLELL